MSDTFIRFSETNVTSFINLNDTTLLQTDTTRLHFTKQYESIDTQCYLTKLKQSEGLPLQYRANSLDHKAYIVNIVNGVENRTEITTSIVPLTSPGDLSDNRIQYELELNLAPYTGTYCLIFDFIYDPLRNAASFQSEWFNVQSEFENCLQIGCSNNSDLATYSDGIIWNDRIPTMWLHSRLVRTFPIMEKSIVITSTGKEITTWARVGKGKIWEVEPISEFMMSKLNIWLGKHFFYINGEWLNSEETFETEMLGDINLYPFELNMTLVEDVQGNGYEDYSEDQPISGTPPVIPDTLRTTGLETRTTGLEDRKINN